MKNTHIEHPEDSILNGDLSVLDWFTSNGKISAKIDGAPAIVWGTNPANGRYFVGTKSVFNKKLIKINHDHEEIDQNHQGKVATILHDCLDCLPATDGIFQGDFIGIGGDNCYRPNTITYVFDEIGLFSWEGTAGAGNLLTHVIFHPVQKSLNRLIQIDYTIRKL
mgnify:CR=1 FL=1